jgi:hypothetical protein
MGMRWQVAVESSQDAAAAVRAGAVGLDLLQSAPERVRAICTQVRHQADGILISVTLPPPRSPAALRASLQPLREAGVDRVAVPLGDAATAAAMLRLLAGTAWRAGLSDGPVLMPVLSLPAGVVPADAVGRLEALVSLSLREGVQALVIDLDAAASPAGAFWRARPVPARVPRLIRTLQRSGIEVGVKVQTPRQDLARLLDWGADFASLACWERDARGERVLDVDRLLERLRDPRTPQSCASRVG